MAAPDTGDREHAVAASGWESWPVRHIQHCWRTSWLPLPMIEEKVTSSYNRMLGSDLCCKMSADVAWGGCLDAASLHYKTVIDPSSTMTSGVDVPLAWSDFLRIAMSRCRTGVDPSSSLMKLASAGSLRPCGFCKIDRLCGRGRRKPFLRN